MRARIGDFVAALASIAAPLLLYGSVTKLFWTWDDPFLLRVAHSHRVAEYFFSPVLWRSMPMRVFTPLLLASYEGELALFGANPRPFYVVQLLQIGLLTAVIFAALRLWFELPLAAGAALTFVAGLPVAIAASQLMVMHYLESLTLAGLSTVLFVIAVRRRAPSLSFASALAYLAAMLAKEIAVPLLLLLLVLPVSSWRSRFRASIPHVVVAVLYVAWRYAAVGTLLGGYGWTAHGTEFEASAASAPWRMLLLMVQTNQVVGLLLLVWMGVGIALRCRSRRDFVVMIAAVVVATAPFILIAKSMEIRHTLPLWLCLLVLSVAGFATLSRRAALACVAVLITFTLVVNRAAWPSEYGRASRMSEEGRTFLSLGTADAIRNPTIPPAAMAELKWLKEELLNRTRGTRWFYDDLFLCETAELPERVLEWVDSRHSLVDVTAGMTPLRARYCSSIRWKARLAARFHHEDDTLSWTFGPYDRGVYSVVFGDGIQAFEIPPSDSFRLPGVEALRLRVRYRAPEGWVTYSPELTLNFREKQNFEWRQ